MAFGEGAEEEEGFFFAGAEGDEDGVGGAGGGGELGEEFGGVVGGGEEDADALGSAEPLGSLAGVFEEDEKFDGCGLKGVHGHGLSPRGWGVERGAAWTAH